MPYQVSQANRIKVRALKKEANEAKGKLIKLEMQIRELDPRRANELGRIIGRLEAWQNS